MFVTIDVNPVGSLLAGKDLYIFRLKSGGPQIAQSSLDVPKVVDKPDYLVNRIRNEIRCFVSVIWRLLLQSDLSFAPRRVGWLHWPGRGFFRMALWALVPCFAVSLLIFFRSH